MAHPATIAADLDVGIRSFEFGEGAFESGTHVAKRDASLWLLGAGKACLHRGEIECQRGRESSLTSAPEDPLFLEVGFDQGELLLGTAGEAQVVEGLLIGREEAHRRTVFGRHVGER